jgi:predicted GNAT family acetyltransferase
LILKSFPIVLSALLLSIILTAVPAISSNKCSEIFSTTQVLESTILKTTGIFNKEPLYSLDRNIHDINLREKLLASEHNGKFEVTLIKVQYAEGLAYLYYREFPGTNAIIIDMVSVPHALHRQGISSKLFSMVLEQLPRIDKIVFELDMVNKEFFDQNKSIPFEQRLAATPIYKSLSKLGFTHIDHISEVKIFGKVFPHIILNRQPGN